MPYIKKNDRAEIFGELGSGCLDASAIRTPGELNYAITELIIAYTKGHGKNYETLNAVVGALECAKLEFQRRVVAPYEDQKIRENGDVYPVIL